VSHCPPPTANPRLADAYDIAVDLVSLLDPSDDMQAVMPSLSPTKILSESLESRHAASMRHSSLV